MFGVEFLIPVGHEREDAGIAEVAYEEVDQLTRAYERSQLAVSSRSEPALALGRMRVGAEIVELDIDDLSMSPVEAAEASPAQPQVTAKPATGLTELWPGPDADLRPKTAIYEVDAGQPAQTCQRTDYPNGTNTYANCSQPTPDP